MSKPEDINPFDELGADAGPQDTENHNKLDYLIHKTFEQSESGRELLAIWKEALMMNPGASPGDDQIAIGINEGTKQFIRRIILTVRKVSNE